MQQKILLFLLLFCCELSDAQSGDTLSITLEKAEKKFLLENGLLLAQQYNISAVKANEIQTSLYNNPVLTAEWAAYSGGNNKWFDIGKSGQKAFSIDQLITLSGKRNKRLLLAKEQTREAEIIFYDMLRTLRYQLRIDFYRLAYANELIAKYDEQIRLLQKIILAYDDQAAKRNVSLKDAVRLKTEFIQLSADRSTLVLESIEALQNLRILLDTSVVIYPQKVPDANPLLFSADQLVQKAKQYRTDLQLDNIQLQQERLNYNYQRALRTPDLNIGAGYDQNGSYMPNYYSLHAGIELPFFNRNKGNIKSAKARIQSSALVRDYTEQSIAKEITAAIEKVNETEKEYGIANENFSNNFPEVNKAVIENFNKGNISILEFMDFFENYNAAIRQLNLLQKQRRLAREDLEYTVGTSVY
jgi:cobalt-zinc-cadmium efflux system outer membrane protein